MFYAQVVLDYVETTGHPIEDTDILTNLELWSAAEDYVEEYDGQASFMGSLKEQIKFKRLTPAQAKVALNILVDTFNPIIRDEFVPSNTVQKIIPNGYYTLEDGNDYITIRIKDYPDRPGVQKFGYLIGSDNTKAYMNCGSIFGSSLQLWAHCENSIKLKQDFSRLLQTAQDKTIEGLGRLYALRSGNCWMCGKMLTTPESKRDLVGPICKAKAGM